MFSNNTPKQSFHRLKKSSRVMVEFLGVSCESKKSIYNVSYFLPLLLTYFHILFLNDSDYEVKVS